MFPKGDTYELRGAQARAAFRLFRQLDRVSIPSVVGGADSKLAMSSKVAKTFFRRAPTDHESLRKSESFS